MQCEQAIAGLTCVMKRRSSTALVRSSPNWYSSAASTQRPSDRGLHSFTFQLNVSAFCGIEGVLRVFMGLLGGVGGY